jgi:tellurite methyltransferase
MSAKDRVRWDTYFRKAASQPYPAPDPLLLQFTPLATPDARALDLCGGMGQNGLWLASQGYSVDVMDISRVALSRGRTEMMIRNLRTVNLLPIDVDGLSLEANVYDVICVFRYLRRDWFDMLKAAVKPGGRLIYETYNRRYLELVPGFNQAFLLAPNELCEYFRDWQMFHWDEEDHNTRMVAVKP